MSVDRAEIVRVVDEYFERYPADVGRLGIFLDAVAGGGELVSRKAVPGHVTCSAYVIGDPGDVLHVWHRTFGRWIQPGGHLEPGDADLASAARREVAEETGIPGPALRALAGRPVDIDLHRVPANAGRGEPEHWHFDVRYAFAVQRDIDLTPQLDEVSALRWIALDDPESVTAERDVAQRLKALR